jgi:hypothetical protein
MKEEAKVAMKCNVARVRGELIVEKLHLRKRRRR